MLKLAASVERNSEHPLAEAVVKYAEFQEVSLAEVEDFVGIVGSGVQGIVNDHLLQISTEHWLADCPDRNATFFLLPDQLKVVVYLELTP